MWDRWETRSRLRFCLYYYGEDGFWSCRVGSKHKYGIKHTVSLEGPSIGMRSKQAGLLNPVDQKNSNVERLGRVHVYPLLSCDATVRPGHALQSESGWDIGSVSGKSYLNSYSP